MELELREKEVQVRKLQNQMGLMKLREKELERLVKQLTSRLEEEDSGMMVGERN